MSEHDTNDTTIPALAASGFALTFTALACLAWAVIRWLVITFEEPLNAIGL